MSTAAALSATHRRGSPTSELGTALAANLTLNASGRGSAFATVLSTSIRRRHDSHEVR